MNKSVLTIFRMPVFDISHPDYCGMVARDYIPLDPTPVAEEVGNPLRGMLRASQMACLRSMSPY